MSLILQDTPSANLPAQPMRMGEEMAPAAPQQAGPTLGAAGEERPFLRLDLLRALHLHRRLALGIALAGVVAAIALAARMWPIYVAKSQIYIQPVPPRMMDQNSQQRTWPYDANTYESFIQQQAQNSTNPEVLKAALHKMPAGSFQRDGESEQVAVRRLNDAIEVARIGTSYEVSITARTSDPTVSAQVANAVAASVVERAAGEANAGDADRLAILKEERDRVQKELADDHTEQDSLNKQLGMAAVGSAAPDLIDNAIDKTREELIKARTVHDEAAAKFNAMGSSASLDAQAEDLIAADAGLTSMKTSLNQRRAVLISQMANLTPNNPAYKQDAEELAQINKNLDSMMSDLRAKAAGRIQQQLRAQLVSTASVEAQLNGQLRQLTGTAADATPKLQRAGDLTADISRLQARFSAVDEQIHNLMLQDSVPGAVHISVPAVAPLHPNLSGILKKTLPIAVAGILLGLLAALLAHNFDQRLYVAADVERVLNAAPMAVLPDFSEVSEETAAEHLLRIATSVEHACKQGSLRHMIFTGAGRGVGTTTITSRVKMMLDAMGRGTALIHTSGAPPASAAAGVTGAQSLVVAERGSRSTALLQQVAEDSAPQTEDKLVITDAAPLTLSAETAYLARFVDCVIVVVESGVTTRAQLREAANTLQRLNVTAAGFVLNRVRLSKADPVFRSSVLAVESHIGAQVRPEPEPEARTTRQVVPEAVYEQQAWEPQTYAAPAHEPQSSEPRNFEPRSRELRDYFQPRSPEPEPSEPQVAELQASEPKVYEPLPFPTRVFEPQVKEPEASVQQPVVPAAEQAPAPVRFAPRASAEPQNIDPIVPEWTPAPEARAPLSPPAPPLAVEQPAAPEPALFESGNAAPRNIDPIVSEWTPEPPVSAPLPPQVPLRVVEPPAPPQPVARPESDLPWWLADAVLQPAAAPAPAQLPATFVDQPLPAAPAAFTPPQPAEHGSRLSGLRNIFSRSHKQPAAEPQPQPDETLLPGAYQQQEWSTVAPAYQRPMASLDPVPAAPVPATAIQVTAAPEFLPPPRHNDDLAPARRDRRQALDDLAILPSRRGQYRRKS